MKVAEFYSRTLNDNLKNMDLCDVKVHSNDNGDVQCVEVKYKVANINEKEHSELFNKNWRK